tara:strand:+ start:678 stop:1343 length:666 start_codon:yes stop_codon:yes gene_type:complete
MLVTDNALPEDDRLKLINSLSFQTMIHKSDYNWWDGWWSCPPRNQVEQTIYKLWSPHLDGHNDGGGFEYWSRECSDIHEGLAWHQDTDESFYYSDKYNIATASMVYYPIVDNLLGGSFEVYPYDEREKLLDVRKYLQYANDIEKEVIRAVQNRVVIYDSARVHRIGPMYRGYRKNLVASFWAVKPEGFAKSENLKQESTQEDPFWEVVPATWEEKYEKDLN